MGLILLKQIITMFIILGIGVICYKTKLVSEKGNKELSNLLLMVVNPLIMFLSFQQDYDSEKIKNFIFMLGLSVLFYCIMIPVINLLIAKKNKEFNTERFSAIYSNCGFFGIPIIYSIFGTEGVFYLTAPITIFNIFAWTHGVSLFKGDGKITLKTVIRNIANPTIIACVLGFIFYVTRMKLPEQLLGSIEYVGNMNTPLAMLIAGITLAQADITKIFREKRVYYITAIKLIIAPVLTMLLLYFIPLESELKTILIIVSGCPSATSGIMFALRYGKNALYASSLYVVTTLVSLLTLPLIVLFSQWLA